MVNVAGPVAASTGTDRLQWPTVRLGNVVEVCDSRRMPLNSEQRSQMQGPYPYFGANGIVDYVNDYLFDGEYVLVAEDGGRWGPFEPSAYVVTGRFWVNNHAHVLRCADDAAHNEFVCHTLNFMDISGFISGTTRGKLNQGVLKGLPISLPPLPEQHAIARVLRSVQQAIGSTEAIIAAIRELKKAVMRHLFTYGAVSVDAVASVRLKETEIGLVPEHWRVTAIGDEATLQRGFDITKKDQRPGQVPVISSGGIASYHDTPKVAGPGVVIGRKGTLGTAFYVEGEFWPHDTTLWVKDFHGNDPKFVYYFFQHFDVSSFDVGASKPTLNRNHLHPVAVAWPPAHEQRTISRTLTAIETKLVAEENHKRALEALLKTLVHDLMTGRVRVGVSTSEHPGESGR